MIRATRLTRQYGANRAVDDLTFEVKPGTVTGFLGPNGAGKSTTMRLILGLERPTSGSVTVNGRDYSEIPVPINEIGSLLDASAVHGGRTAYHHLQWQAAMGNLANRRVDEVLDIVGLSQAAHEPVGGYSLGMRQRLGIAGALLGDPEILMLDEPVNGLDPEGIRWIRSLISRLADEGRTLFVSSHLMHEMEEIADHVIVIGNGQLIADMSAEEFTRQSSTNHVYIESPEAEKLLKLIQEQGGRILTQSGETITTQDIDAPQIAELALEQHILIHELVTREASLEEAFFEMTKDSVQFRAA